MFNFIYTFICFILSAFFFLLGIICLILPWSAAVRTDLIEFILENTTAIGLFGLGLFIIGSIIMINLILGFKKCYYYVHSAKYSVAVDETLIQQYLQSYMKQLYPQHEIPTRLIIKKNKIKVIADLPYTPRLQQPIIIERMQQDLNDIFKRILGYTNDFFISISFPKKLHPLESIPEEK